MVFCIGYWEGDTCMIDLNSFTYFELETLEDLVDSKIKSKYKLAERHPSLFDMDKGEIDDLMLLKVKITEHLKTLPQPSAFERIKNNKRNR